MTTPADYLDEFLEAFAEQLKIDHERWGDTWLSRPTEGQELRVQARFNDYFDQHAFKSIPVPWLKVMGNAFIAWIREAHPELFPKGPWPGRPWREDELPQD